MSGHTELDGHALKSLINAAILWFENHIEDLNAIDVYPVPSGNAGTRIYLTLKAGYKEMNSRTITSAGEVAQFFAHGTLLGARGHQGVPFSQWFRGFARELSQKNKINANDFANALAEAADCTHRTEIKPIVGQMWTVAMDVAEAAKRAAAEKADISYVLEKSVAEAKHSVNRTPQLIPVLKDVGVVHSGGLALYFLLDGMNRCLKGEINENTQLGKDDKNNEFSFIVNISATRFESLLESTQSTEEWETVVDFRPKVELDLQAIYERLENIGTSIQIREGDGVYRIHIHLLKKDRYEPIKLAQELGTVEKVYMKDLLDQKDYDL